MALLEWSDGLSTGIGEIDRQHRELIRMTNELHEAMRHGKGRDAIGAILAGLVEYTLTHFAYEEGEFAREGYPELAEHEGEHRAFVGKVGDFRAGFEAGKLGLSVEVLNFLSGWLTDHIMGSDRKAGAFLRSKGLS